jgi:hypothetical protein
VRAPDSAYSISFYINSWGNYSISGISILFLCVSSRYCSTIPRHGRPTSNWPATPHLGEQSAIERLGDCASTGVSPCSRSGLPDRQPSRAQITQ